MRLVCYLRFGRGRHVFCLEVGRLFFVPPRTSPQKQRGQRPTTAAQQRPHQVAQVLDAVDLVVVQPQARQRLEAAQVLDARDALERQREALGLGQWDGAAPPLRRVRVVGAAGHLNAGADERLGYKVGLALGDEQLEADRHGGSAGARQWRLSGRLLGSAACAVRAQQLLRTRKLAHAPQDRPTTIGLSSTRHKCFRPQKLT